MSDLEREFKEKMEL